MRARKEGHRIPHCFVRTRNKGSRFLGSRSLSVSIAIGLTVCSHDDGRRGRDEQAGEDEAPLAIRGRPHRRRHARRRPTVSPPRAPSRRPPHLASLNTDHEAARIAVPDQRTATRSGPRAREAVTAPRPPRPLALSPLRRRRRPRSHGALRQPRWYSSGDVDALSPPRTQSPLTTTLELSLIALNTAPRLLWEQFSD